MASFAWASAALAGLWLQYTDRGRVVVGLGAATLMFDSLLNTALIPSYGMRGAAASTALTLTVAACALALAARRSGPVPFAGA